MSKDPRDESEARESWELTVDAYRYHLEALGRSSYTIRSQISTLRCFCRFAAEAKGDPLRPPITLIERYLGATAKKHTRWTLRGYFLNLRTFYRWVKDRGLSPIVPFDGLAVPRAPENPRKPYDREELVALREGVVTPRDQALILLLIATGMRANELVSLRAADVDWKEGTLIIRYAKGGKNRVVAPGRTAMAALQAHVDGAGIMKGPIFSLRPDSLFHFIAHLGRRVGVEGANCHRFRNTFAHEFLAGGGDVGDLKEILGHSTIRMSLAYASYYATERALRANRRFNPADLLFGDPQDPGEKVVPFRGAMGRSL